MPRPPKAKDASANLALVQRFSHCIPRSLGEGGHLAPLTAQRESAFIRSEATPPVLLRSREANEAKNNMVALPSQLFYSAQIPVCLWFLAKNKAGGAGKSAAASARDRRKQTLFIDARKLGTLIDRALGYIRTLN